MEIHYNFVMEIQAYFFKKPAGQLTQGNGFRYLQSQSFRHFCCFYLSQPLSMMIMHSFIARKNYQYMVQIEQHWQERNELSILLNLILEATALCPQAYS